MDSSVAQSNIDQTNATVTDIRKELNKTNTILEEFRAESQDTPRPRIRVSQDRFGLSVGQVSQLIWIIGELPKESDM
jgi:hypothetical protein